MRDALDALFRELVFRDVGRHRKAAEDFSLVADMRQQLDLDVAGFAVLRAVDPLVGHRMPEQHLSEMVFDLPVDRLAEDFAHVPADDVVDGDAEKFGVVPVDEAAAQLVVPGHGHRGHVIGEQAQFLGAFAQGLLRADALGVVVEHRDLVERPAFAVRAPARP